MDLGVHASSCDELDGGPVMVHGVFSTPGESKAVRGPPFCVPMRHDYGGFTLDNGTLRGRKASATRNVSTKARLLVPRLPCITCFGKPVPKPDDCEPLDPLAFLYQQWIIQQEASSGNNPVGPKPTPPDPPGPPTPSCANGGQYLALQQPWQILSMSGSNAVIQTAGGRGCCGGTSTAACVNLPSTYYCQSGNTAIVDTRGAGACGGIALVTSVNQPGSRLM